MFFFHMVMSDSKKAHRNRTHVTENSGLLFSSCHLELIISKDVQLIIQGILDPSLKSKEIQTQNRPFLKTVLPTDRAIKIVLKVLHILHIGTYMQ